MLVGFGDMPIRASSRGLSETTDETTMKLKWSWVVSWRRNFQGAIISKGWCLWFAGILSTTHCAFVTPVTKVMNKSYSDYSTAIHSIAMMKKNPTYHYYEPLLFSTYPHLWIHCRRCRLPISSHGLAAALLPLPLYWPRNAEELKTQRYIVVSRSYRHGNI